MSGQPTALARARQIRTVLLDHGAPEVSIELQPGRPVGSGRDVWNALDPVGVASHHIVSSPTPERPTPGLALVKGGRSDLGPPLCNGTAGVDLVYRILCLGWANHPGFGGPLVVRGPLGAFTIPRDNARPYLWGTEWEGGLSEAVWDRTYRNARTGKTMTFREFMGRCNAGLVEAIWLDGLNSRGKYDQIHPTMDLSGYHVEHSTWTDRKIDRLGYTTEEGRAEIRRHKLTQEDDDMADPKTQAQLARTEKAATAAAGDAAAIRQTADRLVDLLTDPDKSKILRKLDRNTTKMHKALTLLRKVRDGMAVDPTDLAEVEAELAAELEGDGE